MRSAWCRMIGCDSHWVPLDGALLLVCRRCRVVSAILGCPRSAAILALQGTMARPSDDFEGAVE